MLNVPTIIKKIDGILYSKKKDSNKCSHVVCVLMALMLSHPYTPKLHRLQYCDFLLSMDPFFPSEWH